jgi:hypothetical protein
MKRFQIYLQITFLGLGVAGMAGIGRAEHTETGPSQAPSLETPAAAEPGAPSTVSPNPAPQAAAPVAPARIDKDACKDDFKKFCSGVRPGRGRGWQCLKQHEAELAPACQEHLSRMRDRLEKKKEQISQACQADKEQFCKDVLPGDGRIAKCMKEHREQLSAGCKESMKNLRPAKGPHRKMDGKKPVPPAAAPPAEPSAPPVPEVPAP